MRAAQAFKAIIFLLGTILVLCIASPACAAGPTDTPPPAESSPALLALAFLAPAAFALLAAAAQPAERAWDVALSALLALGVAAVAYFVCGFALQFGGLGLWHPDPTYTGLDMHWSALGEEYGPRWGMVGLRGFLLSGAASEPAALRLFLAQLPLLTIATMIPLLALRGRVPASVTLLASLLMAFVVYPLLGNWTWGGGWLAQLGTNLNLGHGVIDLSGAGPVHLAGAALAFAGLLTLVPLRPRRSPYATPTPLPAAHLPVLGVLGALLLPLAWYAVILAQPWPDWSGLAPELVGINIVLAAGAGALLPGLYTWFAVGRPDPIMVARGLAAASIAISASAPFITPGVSLAVGILIGILIPVCTYLVLERLRVEDQSGIVVMHGLGGLLGLLVPALFASGQYGIGWNGVGSQDYLGVAEQGVTGLWAAAGYQPDWHGQMVAQLTGAGANILFPLLLGLILFQVVRAFMARPRPSRVRRRPATMVEEEASTPSPGDMTS